MALSLPQSRGWNKFKLGEAHPSPTNRPQITESDLATLFHNSTLQMARGHAAEELQEQAGCGQAACYNALKPTGRFASARSGREINPASVR